MADPYASLTDYVSTKRYKQLPDGTMVEDTETIKTPNYSGAYTTPGDIRRAQQAATAEYGVNAAIGAVGSAAQLGTSLIDTQQDTRNKQELGRLKALEKRGKLGLTGEERSTYERGLLNPVKAIAADMNARQQAVAAAGPRRDAASVVRDEREAARRLDQAAADAAQKIEAAHIARKAEQRKELEERTSYESGRETQRLNYVAQSIPGLLANVGKAAAGIALPAQVTDAQIVQMQRATDANGRPVYPGIQNLSPDAARELVQKSIRAETWGTFANKNDLSARDALRGGAAYSGGG